MENLQKFRNKSVTFIAVRDRMFLRDAQIQTNLSKKFLLGDATASPAPTALVTFI